MNNIKIPKSIIKDPKKAYGIKKLRKSFSSSIPEITMSPNPIEAAIIKLIILMTCSTTITDNPTLYRTLYWSLKEYNLINSPTLPGIMRFNNEEEKVGLISALKGTESMASKWECKITHHLNVRKDKSSIKRATINSKMDKLNANKYVKNFWGLINQNKAKKTMIEDINKKYSFDFKW